MSSSKRSATASRRSRDDGRFGRDLIAALDEAVAHAQGRKKLTTYEVDVPKKIDVPAIRAKLKLTQEEFAARFGFNVTVLRSWEQGKRKPARAAQVLLTIIDREPKAVQRALAA